ncbi:MAG: VanZ family protein [Bacteroidetes bacterium]|nr:VanZ family protein [Bacteroidota bacterium]
MNSPGFLKGSAIGYMCLIFFLSSIPGKTLTPIFELSADKLIHLAEYWGLGFLLLRWWSGTTLGQKRIRLYLVVLLFGMFFAFVDETWQGFIPGRSKDPLDFLADTTGIIISILIFHFASHFGSLQKWIRPNQSSATS